MMISIKVTTTGLGLTLLAIVTLTSSLENDEDLIRISDAWLKKYGCPRKGPYIWGCLETNCQEAGDKRGEATHLIYCREPKILDSWKPGSPCPAKLDFYSKCSYCQCNEEGTKADCDVRACKYYPQNVSTTTKVSTTYDYDVIKFPEN